MELPPKCQSHGAFLLFEGDPYLWRRGVRTQWFIDYYKFDGQHRTDYFGYNGVSSQRTVIRELLRMMEMLDHRYYLIPEASGPHYKFCSIENARQIYRQWE